jgi:hypothetical protein
MPRLTGGQPASDTHTLGASASWKTRRSRRTTAATRLAPSSISASPCKGLRLKRIAKCSTPAGTPIASNTGDGNSEAADQAERRRQTCCAS